MENEKKKQAKITAIVYTPIKTWDYLTETREYQAWDDYYGNLVSTTYCIGAKTAIDIYGIPQKCRNERIIKSLQKCASDEKTDYWNEKGSSAKELKTLGELVKILDPYKARFLKIAKRLSEKYDTPLFINTSRKATQGR